MLSGSLLFLLSISLSHYNNNNIIIVLILLSYPIFMMILLIFSCVYRQAIRSLEACPSRCSYIRGCSRRCRWFQEASSISLHFVRQARGHQTSHRSALTTGHRCVPRNSIIQTLHHVWTRDDTQASKNVNCYFYIIHQAGVLSQSS